jgi:hypothetical protein
MRKRQLDGAFEGQGLCGELGHRRKQRGDDRERDQEQQSVAQDKFHSFTFSGWTKSRELAIVNEARIRTALDEFPGPGIGVAARPLGSLTGGRVNLSAKKKRFQKQQSKISRAEGSR